MFRPMHNRVVIRRSDADTVSAGGVILSVAHLEKSQEGEVVAAGPGAFQNGTLVTMTVAAGDKVLFGRYAGTEVTLDGEKLVILKEDDILGIIGE